MRILVTGAGGFIGGHLVKRLLDDGHEVRGVDIKPVEKWWQLHDAAENIVADLRLRSECMGACKSMQRVFNLAADMGGIGFIEKQKKRCMLSVLINTHMLLACEFNGVRRYLFTSSACVYAKNKQDYSNMPSLKERDAYPAQPEDGYGWEKLFSERMCRHFWEEGGLEVRIPRLHNVYGPKGSWRDGREKAPAAICRKVAEAKLSGAKEIEVWGDGTFTRSFMWIDDCVEGLCRIMDGEWRTPINLGSEEQVAVNGLVDTVEDIAGVKLERRYDLTKAQGVPGRNSDNWLIRKQFGWEPKTPLREGLAKTYQWIEEQVRGAHRNSA